MLVREYILILCKDIVVLVPAFGESLLAPVLVSIVFPDFDNDSPNSLMRVRDPFN